MFRLGAQAFPPKKKKLMPKKAEKFPGPLEHRFANDWARETPSEK